MYNKITANLMVNDVGETLDFYERILGFNMVMAVPENSRETITARRDDTALDFAIVKCDGVELMFQSRKSLSGEDIYAVFPGCSYNELQDSAADNGAFNAGR